MKAKFKESKDLIERKMLENSNIRIITKDKSLNSTYAYAYKSKLSFSFGSTMTMEFLGMGKPSFFIDPELRNQQWYHDIKFLKNYRLKSYNQLKKVVLSKNKKNKVNTKIRKYFCLNSKKTSKRIANYFLKYN